MDKNKTKSKAKAVPPVKASIKPEIMPEAQPVSDYEYDDRYVKFYCSNPLEGKKQAIINAGYAGKYPTQESCRIHKRNLDKIEANVKERKQGLGLLSVYQLEQILTKDADKVGYSNMLQAATKGLDYAGHKPSDKLEIIEKDQSFEDLQAEIKENDRQLKEQTH